MASTWTRHPGLDGKVALVTGGSRGIGAADTFPLGRTGEPEDVAQTVLYLASPASSWVTGATLDLTGGRVIA